MSAVEWIPHLIGTLNGATAVLIAVAGLAIRRGRRNLHKTLMLTSIGLGALFLILYVVHLSLVGHSRFPGNDWVRSVFLVILTSHTFLAVLVVPLILRSLYLATKARFVEHRRIARIALPIWLYVAVTGVALYWMNNHLRPAPGVDWARSPLPVGLFVTTAGEPLQILRG
jgi:putative membrane protein